MVERSYVTVFTEILGRYWITSDVKLAERVGFEPTCQVTLTI